MALKILLFFPRYCQGNPGISHNTTEHGCLCSPERCETSLVFLKTKRRHLCYSPGGMNLFSGEGDKQDSEMTELERFYFKINPRELPAKPILLK